MHKVPVDVGQTQRFLNELQLSEPRKYQEVDVCVQFETSSRSDVTLARQDETKLGRGKTRRKRRQLVF